MALGRHIAAELSLEDRGDWLRHWLAHHVAELVTEAETAEDVETRREAEKRATEAILKIWGHRETIPGEVYPLAQYREVLQFLSELRSAFGPAVFHDDVSQGSVAAKIYRRFPRLIEALVLLPVVRSKKQDRETAESVRKFLKPDEEALLSTFETRIKVIGEQGDERTSGEGKDDYQRFEEAVHELVNQTIADLKSALEKDAKKSRESPRARSR